MILSKLSELGTDVVQSLSELSSDYNYQLTLALLGITGATYFLYRIFQKSSEYPPGPSTLPVLGNLHQVALCDANIVNFLEKYRRIYGNVYTVTLGGVQRVVVSGYENMQELLEKNGDITSNRTTETMPKNYSENAGTRPGLFWAEYPHWKTIRSFALSQLREEGMGKSSLEPKLMEELEMYIEHFITPALGEPIDLHTSMNLATANVIFLLLFGKRQQYTDEEFLKWQTAFDESVIADMKAAIFRNVPIVKYLPGDLAGMKTNKKHGAFVIESSAKWVEDARKEVDTDNPVGFLDNFITHSEKLGDKGEQNHCFTDGNAAISCLQLYGAGMETTATALRWAFLYMSVYPQIQAKVKAEIDQVVGQREVVYKDRLDMPYIEAVMMEVLRLSNIAPTALPHKLERSLVIDGKTIPAGAELMLNQASVLHDELVYEEPLEFRPDRFLTGDVELKKSHNIAFGMGRRACLGRDLAKMEFFLFFVSFMQRFDVTCDGIVPPSIKGTPTLVNAPPPHKLIFTSR